MFGHLLISGLRLYVDLYGEQPQDQLVKRLSLCGNSFCCQSELISQLGKPGCIVQVLLVSQGLESLHHFEFPLALALDRREGLFYALDLAFIGKHLVPEHTTLHVESCLDGVDLIGSLCALIEVLARENILLSLPSAVVLDDGHGTVQVLHHL